MVQIVAKCLIILFLMGVAALASARVWHADLDLRRLLSPRGAVESSVKGQLGWLPTRDSTAIYQGGVIVARIEGAAADEAKSTVDFELVYGAKGLDTTAAVEFRGWRLRFVSVEEHHEWTSRYPDKGPVMIRVKFAILGARPVL